MEYEDSLKSPPTNYYMAPGFWQMGWKHGWVGVKPVLKEYLDKLTA